MSRILIVHDCDETRRGMRFDLECAGFAVLEARDGLAALQRAVEDAPELVVLDAYLPGLDGFELCGRLRAEPRTRHIPVLLCSPTASAVEVERARRFGAFDHLPSPIPAAQLHARIARALASPSRCWASMRPWRVRGGAGEPAARSR